MSNEILKAEDSSEFSFNDKNVTIGNTLPKNREKYRERNDHAFVSPRWNFLSTDSFEKGCNGEEDCSSESLLSVYEPQTNDEDFI